MIVSATSRIFHALNINHYVIIKYIQKKNDRLQVIETEWPKSDCKTDALKNGVITLYTNNIQLTDLFKHLNGGIDANIA